MLRHHHVAGLCLFGSLCLPLSLLAQTPGELLPANNDQEFYDLLMLLEAFPELEPISQLSPSSPDSLGEPAESDLEELPEDAADNGEWMLMLLSLLDQASEEQQQQLTAELRSALETLRRAESVSQGELRSTLASAADGIELLLMVTERPTTTVTDIHAPRAIAEAQRAMGLYHCHLANQEADGTLADSLTVLSNRMEHLALGARFMMSAAQTANYRVPAETKRTIASSVAMSKLFPPKEVAFSQIRSRAREITAALQELGTALKRMP